MLLFFTDPKMLTTNLKITLKYKTIYTNTKLQKLWKTGTIRMTRKKKQTVYIRIYSSSRQQVLRHFEIARSLPGT